MGLLLAVSSPEPAGHTLESLSVSHHHSAEDLPMCSASLGEDKVDNSVHRSWRDRLETETDRKQFWQDRKACSVMNVVTGKGR